MINLPSLLFAILNAFYGLYRGALQASKANLVFIAYSIPIRIPGSVSTFTIQTQIIFVGYWKMLERIGYHNGWYLPVPTRLIIVLTVSNTFVVKLACRVVPNQ